MKNIKENFKYYFGLIEIYWNLKSMIKKVFLMTALLIIVSIIMQTGIVFPLALITTTWLTPIIIVTVSWFAEIKPIVEDIEKEIELKNKYSFMYNKFIKGE